MGIERYMQEVMSIVTGAHYRAEHEPLVRAYNFMKEMYNFADEEIQLVYIKNLFKGVPSWEVFYAWKDRIVLCRVNSKELTFQELKEIENVVITLNDAMERCQLEIRLMDGTVFELNNYEDTNVQWKYPYVDAIVRFYTILMRVESN